MKKHRKLFAAFTAAVLAVSASGISAAAMMPTAYFHHSYNTAEEMADALRTTFTPGLIEQIESRYYTENEGGFEKSLALWQENGVPEPYFKGEPMGNGLDGGKALNFYISDLFGLPALYYHPVIEDCDYIAVQYLDDEQVALADEHGLNELTNSLVPDLPEGEEYPSYEEREELTLNVNGTETPAIVGRELDDERTYFHFVYDDLLIKAACVMSPNADPDDFFRWLSFEKVKKELPPEEDPTITLPGFNGVVYLHHPKRVSVAVAGGISPVTKVEVSNKDALRADIDGDSIILYGKWEGTFTMTVYAGDVSEQFTVNVVKMNPGEEADGLWPVGIYNPVKVGETREVEVVTIGGLGGPGEIRIEDESIAVIVEQPEYDTVIIKGVSAGTTNLIVDYLYEMEFPITVVQGEEESPSEIRVETELDSFGNLLYVGEDYWFDVTVTGGPGKLTEIEVEDESIISAEYEGGSIHIETLDNGSTTLTVHAGAYSQEFPIYVEYMEMGDGIRIEGVPSELEVGATATISGVVFGGVPGVYKIEIEDESIAVIEEEINHDTVMIKGVSAGTTTLKFYFGMGCESCEITVVGGEEQQTGDVNGNGEVDILDVVILNKALLGAEKLTKDAEKLVDVDGDGKPTAADSLLIMKYLVKLIPSLDAEELSPADEVTAETRIDKTMAVTDEGWDAVRSDTASYVIKSGEQLTTNLQPLFGDAVTRSLKKTYDEKFFEENILLFKLLPLSGSEDVTVAQDDVTMKNGKLNIGYSYTEIKSDMYGAALVQITVPRDAYNAEEVVWTEKNVQPVSITLETDSVYVYSKTRENAEAMIHSTQELKDFLGQALDESGVAKYAEKYPEEFFEKNTLYMELAWGHAPGYECDGVGTKTGDKITVNAWKTMNYGCVEQILHIAVLDKKDAQGAQVVLRTLDDRAEELHGEYNLFNSPDGYYPGLYVNMYNFNDQYEMEIGWLIEDEDCMYGTYKVTSVPMENGYMPFDGSCEYSEDEDGNEYCIGESFEIHWLSEEMIVKFRTAENSTEMKTVKLGYPWD